MRICFTFRGSQRAEMRSARTTRATSRSRAIPSCSAATSPHSAPRSASPSASGTSGREKFRNSSRIACIRSTSRRSTSSRSAGLPLREARREEPREPLHARERVLELVRDLGGERGELLRALRVRLERRLLRRERAPDHPVERPADRAPRAAREQEHEREHRRVRVEVGRRPDARAAAEDLEVQLRDRAGRAERGEREHRRALHGRDEQARAPREEHAGDHPERHGDVEERAREPAGHGGDPHLPERGDEEVPRDRAGREPAPPEAHPLRDEEREHPDDGHEERAAPPRRGLHPREPERERANRRQRDEPRAGHPAEEPGELLVLDLAVAGGRGHRGGLVPAREHTPARAPPHASAPHGPRPLARSRAMRDCAARARASASCTSAA